MPATPIGTWSLQKVQDRIMSRMQPPVDDPDTQVITKVRNEINFQISQLQLKANSSDIESYIVEVPVTFVNNLFDMKSISDFRDFRFLREASFGNIVSVPVDKLDTLFHASYYDNTFMCANYGNDLRLFVGANLTTSGRTFYLKYLRLPIAVVAPTDLIDLLDSYVEQLISNVLAVFTTNNVKTSKPKE